MVSVQIIYSAVTPSDTVMLRLNASEVFLDTLLLICTRFIACKDRRIMQFTVVQCYHCACPFGTTFNCTVCDLRLSCSVPANSTVVSIRTLCVCIYIHLLQKSSYSCFLGSMYTFHLEVVGKLGRLHIGLNFFNSFYN